MNTAQQARLQKFPWSQCALLVVVVLSAGAYSTYVEFRRAGHLNLVAPVLSLWAAAYLTYRWTRLRKELSNGTFSPEAYAANPTSYRLGTVSELRVWGVILIIALMALSLAEGLRIVP